MTTKTLTVALAASLFAFGCADKSGDTGDTGPVGGDDGGATGPTVTTTWGSTELEVLVEGGPDAEYLLGMAETSGSCGDQCWTGEDCAYGYTSPGGETFGPWCHVIDEGTAATLAYGGDAEDLQAGTTVFTDALAGDVTYILWTSDETECFVWGDDPSYYSAFGCEELAR